MNTEEINGLLTELKASMLIMPPNDEYKRGFNSAMAKAIIITEKYKDGNGLFQAEANEKKQ